MAIKAGKMRIMSGTLDTVTLDGGWRKCSREVWYLDPVVTVD